MVCDVQLRINPCHSVEQRACSIPISTQYCLEWLPLIAYRGQSLNGKNTLNGCAISTRAHDFYADFAAKQRAYSIDDDRFTCASFTCKYIEQAVKAQVQGINNCKVF